ncbi:MAG: hypothetical protein K8R92_00850 [Planctomycetes bacterium]|nr:hypothetical protein [Planctomycetota bacterium]
MTGIQATPGKVITIQFAAMGQRLAGFRYLWAKRVRGFDVSCHCANCLIGPYVKEISPRTLTDTELKIELHGHEALYICGVSSPYRWEHNFHFVVEPSTDPEKIVQATTYLGDMVTASGAATLWFDDRVARDRYPHLPERFLTCRNFQFGAFHAQRYKQ